MKPKIVIEIKDGALLGVYTDMRNIDIILVDYDVFEGPASAVVIPDSIEDLPRNTKNLSDDAMLRLFKPIGDIHYDE